MNINLQQLMTIWFHAQWQPNESERGASSVGYTSHIRDNLWPLFEKHKITSMFDGGCNDCTWASLLDSRIKYSGGDISPSLIERAKTQYPHLDVTVFDITTDKFPHVDVLFVRDVTIHLNDSDKKRFLENWLDSGIPWLLTTTEPVQKTNMDFVYSPDQFPFEFLNWQAKPWSFPNPVDRIVEQPGYTRCLALWNRSQFETRPWQ